MASTFTVESDSEELYNGTMLSHSNLQQFNSNPAPLSPASTARPHDLPTTAPESVAATSHPPDPNPAAPAPASEASASQAVDASKLSTGLVFAPQAPSAQAQAGSASAPPVQALARSALAPPAQTRAGPSSAPSAQTPPAHATAATQLPQLVNPVPGLTPSDFLDVRDIPHIRQTVHALAPVVPEHAALFYALNRPPHPCELTAPMGSTNRFYTVHCGRDVGVFDD